MTNYADTDNIDDLISNISTSVSDALKTYALNEADNWINSHIENYTFTTVPALIQQAAEYRVMAFILHNLYDTSTEESSTAVWYDKEAFKYLNSWLSQNEEVGTDANPYSSSQTPNGNYLKTRDSLPDYAPATSETGVRRNRRKILNNDNGTW